MCKVKASEIGFLESLSVGTKESGVPFGPICIPVISTASVVKLIRFETNAHLISLFKWFLNMKLKMLINVHNIYQSKATNCSQTKNVRETFDVAWKKS
jgi:hypothetical protein